MSTDGAGAARRTHPTEGGPAGPAGQGGPRGQADYIEIARCFQAVLVSDIPVLTHTQEDQARRFVTLVDEFYDRGIKLIVSAASAVTEIYQGAKLKFEMQRTQSRLIEMQSQEYLARAHQP